MKDVKTIIISADEIKKNIEGYHPAEAERFHAESAKIADKDLAEALKNPTYSRVVLLCGGSASGKTEYLSEYLIDTGDIIVDGILPTIEGVRVKIRNITRSGKKVSVHIVIPDDLSRAFLAFLHRDRKFSDEHFYKKHSSSRDTALYVAITYPYVDIRIFKSSYEQNTIYFTELVFEDRIKLIEYLKENQLSEVEVIEYINSQRYD